MDRVLGACWLPSSSTRDDEVLAEPVKAADATPCARAQAAMPLCSERLHAEPLGPRLESLRPRGTERQELAAARPHRCHARRGSRCRRRSLSLGVGSRERAPASADTRASACVVGTAASPSCRRPVRAGATGPAEQCLARCATRRKTRHAPPLASRPVRARVAPTVETNERAQAPPRRSYETQPDHGHCQRSLECRAHARRVAQARHPRQHEDGSEIHALRPRRPSGQTWATFLRNHASDIWSCDFLQLSDAWFQPLRAFFIVAHASREILHVNGTRAPTDAWVAQQLREATPYEHSPRFLIRDNDGKFGCLFGAAADGAGIEVVTDPSEVSQPERHL